MTLGFPAVYGARKIDKELNVKLDGCGNPAPLPQWFVKRKKAKLPSVSMIDNFHSYLQNLQETSNNFIKKIVNITKLKAGHHDPLNFLNLFCF